MRKKHAYVSGNKAIGYKLVISAEARNAGYAPLTSYCGATITFWKFRAAQNIANAVNAALKDVRRAV